MADQTSKSARGKRPFSRHPLFPVVLALWSGAILALVGLVVAPAVALTTRVLLALGLGALGALLGVALSRRLNAPKAAAESADTAMAEGDRALWQDLRASRRALIEDTRGTSERADDAELVIEREPQILDVAEFGLEGWSEACEDRVEAKTVAPAEAPAPTAAERITHADLSELSPVELLERLALSMERRRSLAAMEMAPSLAAVEPSVQAGPGVEPAAEDGEPRSGHDLGENGYGSLLDMGGRPRGSLTQYAEHPVQPADERQTDSESAAEGEGGDRPAAPVASASYLRPEDTEEALRAALAALQKMSGAA